MSPFLAILTKPEWIMVEAVAGVLLALELAGIIVGGYQRFLQRLKNRHDQEERQSPRVLPPKKTARKAANNKKTTTVSAK